MNSIQLDDLEGVSSPKGASSQRSSASGIETSSHPSCNSTSDEDPFAIDERKQRRMLSNRESARRSRMRKQQHLDELRAHVAQLRAENSQMMNRFTLATQHYSQLTEENKVLRTQAMDLSHQLQRLHHTLTDQYSNGHYGRGLDSELVQRGTTVRAEISNLSQPVAPASQNR